MNGGYRSLAEAAGETEPGALAFVPGVDFDPSDPEESEIVRLACERDVHDRHTREVRHLRSVVAAMRERLAELDPDAAGWD